MATPNIIIIIIIIIITFTHDERLPLIVTRIDLSVRNELSHETHILCYTI